MDTPERAPSPNINKAWGSFSGIPLAVSINSPSSCSSAGATLAAPPAPLAAVAAAMGGGGGGGGGGGQGDVTSTLKQISEAQQAQCQLIRQLSERLNQLEVEPHRRNSPLTPLRAPPRTMEAIQALRLRTDLPSWGPKALALLEVFTSNPCEETSFTLAEGLWELLQAHLSSPPPSTSSPFHRVGSSSIGSGSGSVSTSWGAGTMNMNTLMSSAAHLFMGGVLGWIAIMILFSGDSK